MKSEQYWENRKVQQMYETMDETENVADEIAKIYHKSSGYLNYQLKAIFERFQSKHKLTEKEAYALLNSIKSPVTIERLMEELRAGGEDKKQILAELESVAYAARLEHLQAVQESIDNVMRDIYHIEKDYNTKHYVNIAYDNYYKNIYEIQKQTGLAFSFAFVDPKAVDSILNSKWSGKNYSERIWKNTTTLGQQLKRELLVNLLTGRTEYEASKIIRNKFASSAMAARRLIRTESAYVSQQIDEMSYKECNIEMYMFIATLDLRTSEVCRSLDGKRFKVSEMQPGKNCNPMHPWCRSTTGATVPEEVLAKLKRRARDPVTNKTYLIPANMNYEQWYKKYVAGNKDAECSEKMLKNKRQDEQQHQKYREIFGKDVPKRLEDFQKMKYNEPEKWNELQLKNLDNKLLTEIKSDKYIKKIEEGKQGKHIVGHNNYTVGRSYLKIDMREAQRIVNEYAGTGTIQRDRNGKWSNKEKIITEEIIGMCVNNVTGEAIATNTAMIHYSKNGVHIVPANPEGVKK